MGTLLTDELLDSVIEKCKEEFNENRSKDNEQKNNKEGNNGEKSQEERNKHLEDSEESTAFNTSQDSPEVEDSEDSGDDVEVLNMDTTEYSMKAPICLIENLATGKLVVKPEAIEVLSKITQPVVVVAVVGLYRTGKSYLMNKLAGANKGFNLGSTVQSETKGIWIWCIPHPQKSDRTLVLLDTEGLGDVEKGDCKNDVWIFSLALLLSSALVYNSRGTIDQDALDKLKFVGDVSNLIKVKAGKKKEENEEDYSTHFPIFIWAVRDFHLELIIDGKPVTADDYMENALRLKRVKPNKKLSKQDEEFNKVRKVVRNYFGKRKCFTFALPTADKQILHKLDEASDSQLNSKFVAQSKKFCKYIFKNAKVKRLDVTVTVNGERLCELAKIYTEAICTSKIACMEDAVVSLSDKENQRAVQEAVQYYQDKMKEFELPTETTAEFFNASKQYEEEARKLFMEKSFRDTDHRFLKEFMINLLNIANEFCAMNEKLSQEICEALIKKHSADFEQALLDGTFLKSGGHVMYMESLLKIEIAYNKESGKGVKGEEVLQNYLKSKKCIELSIIQEDNALSQREREKAEEEIRKQTEEMEKKIRKMEEENLAQKLEQEKTSLQQTIKDLMEKNNEERKLMEEKIAEVLRQKEREREAYMKEAASKEVQDLQRKIDELNRKMDNRSPCVIL